MKKLLLVLLGGALLFILLGRATPSKPSFERTIEDPVMTTDEMEEELRRLHLVNLTVGSKEFDPGIYPAFVGVDFRNGKTLINKFICWDVCPEVGMVFLVYQDVGNEQACVDAKGTPLISPDLIGNEYWGCRPIIDWFNLPSRSIN